MTFTELIDKILGDLGEPVAGTGHFTRQDVLRALSDKQREISKQCRNILAVTASIDVSQDATEITIDSGNNVVDILSGLRTYGGDTRDIFAYSLEDISRYDSAWKTRTGSLIRGLVKGLGTRGTVRPYPIPDNGNNDILCYYLKIATKRTAEFVEAGDAANQLSGWYLTGITDSFLATGNILYWSLTNSGTTRTVKLYSNSAMTAGYLVAQGSRTGDGSITLSAQNDSGISGTVTVAFTIDDNTSANTLTFYAFEIPDEDQECLENGVKGTLLTLERDGKNVKRAALFLEIYEKQKGEALGRAVSMREGSFRVAEERSGDQSGIRTRPYYPWER